MDEESKAELSDLLMITQRKVAVVGYDPGSQDLALSVQQFQHCSSPR